MSDAASLRRRLLPSSSALALVSGLALMPLVIGAGLWRDAGAQPREAAKAHADAFALSMRLAGARGTLQ